MERWAVFSAFQLSPVLDVPCVMHLVFGVQVGVFGEEPGHHCGVC